MKTPRKIKQWAKEACQSLKTATRNLEKFAENEYLLQEQPSKFLMTAFQSACSNRAVKADEKTRDKIIAIMEKEIELSDSDISYEFLYLELYICTHIELGYLSNDDYEFILDTIASDSSYYVPEIVTDIVSRIEG